MRTIDIIRCDIVKELNETGKACLGDDFVSDSLILTASEVEEFAMDKINEVLKEIRDSIVIPCCHVSGIHDPCHFEEKKYVCSMQMRESFKDFLKAMEIKKIKVKSKPNCGWCNDYPRKKQEYYYDIETGEIVD